MEFDIAAIITGHREGAAARASLQSFDNAVSAARAGGLRVQAIQHLDDPDQATQALFDQHKTSATLQIVSALRNAGLARNVAIQAVDADYVAVLDADEIWCLDWLTAAFDYLRASPAHVIAHPQFQFYFGKERRILRIPDQESFEFDLDLARMVDLWSGVGVCRTSILRSVAFRAGHDGQGVMQQDWAWNLDTIATGHVHKVIPQTAIFRHVLSAASPAVSNGPVSLPPLTVLSRYDSALHGARAVSSAVVTDRFLDTVSDIDVIQLHLLLVGRAPVAHEAGSSTSLAAIASQLIGSAEFASRLHRMLDPHTQAIDREGPQLSRDWLERRLSIVIIDFQPEAIARSALTATLSSFPFRPIFERVFGMLSAGHRESLARSAHAIDGRWQGYIDHCSGDLIKGWVLAPNASGPVTIAVRIGKALAGVCEASLYRPDVAQAQGINGVCGFELVPVVDWSMILEPLLPVTLHDVETGHVLPVWTEMPNPRRGALANARATSSTNAPDATFSLVRRERYDDLLARHRLPAPPLPELFLRKPPKVSIVVDADPATIQDLDATLQGIWRQDQPALDLVIVQHDDAETTANFDVQGNAKPVTVVTVQAGTDARETFSRVLSASQGEYVCFVQSGCVLDGLAIAWFVHAIQRFGARIVYADDATHRHAKAGAQRCEADLKPAFDYDLLLQADYMSDVFCASRVDLAAIADLPKTSDSARQYDVLLQLLERVPEDCIFHVPLALHARREHGMFETMAPRPLPLSAERRRAVERHLLRKGAAVTLRDAPATARLDWEGSWSPHWLPTTPRQRIAIIIPTRDRVELLRTCVESLRSMMVDPTSCEFVIMDNGSEDAAALDYLQELRGRANTRVIRSDEPFNWSALNNTAATHTDAELLLFANNDIEVFTEGFDDILRGLLQRPELGAVGTLLLYPGGAIQHAGTAIGIGGVADHIGAGRMPTDHGCSRIARFQRSVGAVTGAFMAVRRTTFEQVGGFDEVDLKIAFNDVDLCLKISAAGQRILYTPRVVCLHHESASRGVDTFDPEKNARAEGEVRALKARWGHRLVMDRHYNTGYDRSSEPFSTVRMPNAAMVLEDLEHQLAWKRLPDDRLALPVEKSKPAVSRRRKTPS